MDALVNAVLSGVLGGRRKRGRNALRFLTRGTTGSVLSNPRTLLGIAGVAWGIFETLQRPSDPGSTLGQGGVNPGSSPGQGVGVPPPLPDASAPSADALRLVRLAVSTANADGVMNEKERAALLAQMTAAGHAELLERELAQPRPLAEIVAGVTEQTDRATLYVLAYTIARADEQISGAERIYLAQLAHLLGLEPALVASLEKDTGERIDALGDQGQLGG
jgi:uncharacterized membrane protein YebE (DUF533 family)